MTAEITAGDIAVPDPECREGAVPGGRDHQGGPGPLLRGCRRADAALAPRPAGDDDALPRRPTEPARRALRSDCFHDWAEPASWVRMAQDRSAPVMPQCEAGHTWSTWRTTLRPAVEPTRVHWPAPGTGRSIDQIANGHRSIGPPERPDPPEDADGAPRAPAPAQPARRHLPPRGRRVAAAFGHRRVPGRGDAASAPDVLAALDESAHRVPLRVFLPGVVGRTSHQEQPYAQRQHGDHADNNDRGCTS